MISLERCRLGWLQEHAAGTLRAVSAAVSQAADEPCSFFGGHSPKGSEVHAPAALQPVVLAGAEAEQKHLRKDGAEL